MPSAPTTDSSAVAGLLCFDLYSASRAMTALYRPLLAPLGLTYPQYLVMVVLWDRDGCTIKDLAATLRLDHGTLTPLLRRMERGDLLTLRRSPVDQRAVEVSLTAAGDSLRSCFQDVQCAVQEALGLTRAEASALQQTLRALTTAITPSPE